MTISQKNKIVKNVTNLLKLWPSKGEGHNKRKQHGNWAGLGGEKLQLTCPRV